MDKIHVKSSIKRLQINDSDDYIELNFNDSTLPARFIAMAEKIQNRTLEENKKHETIDTNNAKEVFLAFHDLQKPIGEEIDAFFGEGTCMKIWGCSNPRADLCMEFFEKIAPYLNEFTDSFAAAISKYNPNRIGNV